jgi:hypothetical protein
VHPALSTNGVTRERAREFAEEVRRIIRRDVDEPPALPTEVRSRAV